MDYTNIKTTEIKYTITNTQLEVLCEKYGASLEDLDIPTICELIDMAIDEEI